MPILGILASSMAAAKDSYESIATVSVGAGGTSSVDFTSIPNTYTHLQLRYIAQTNRGTYGIAEYELRFNNSTTDYNYHPFYGDGSSVASLSYSFSSGLRGDGEIGTSTGGTFGGGVLDILDYANTNKNKTVRWLGGVDINGTIAGYGGRVGLFSGLWRSTSAITSIKLVPYTGSLFTQYSHFALYGIKSA